ncbi:MAG: nucleotidyl transferase AbiEii/AbiGii toxin family protein [Thermoleophilaceae bacterium]
MARTAAEWPEFRPAELLRALVAHGVDFVVIGGLALVFHGSTRVTQDLDICFSTDPGTLDVLAIALAEMDARLFGVEEDLPFVPDARTLRKTETLTLATRLGKLDLLACPSGAPPYAELRARAEVVTVTDFAFRVATPEHLIAMKRAAGRAKDLADVEELEAIVDLRRSGR